MKTFFATLAAILVAAVIIGVAMTFISAADQERKSKAQYEAAKQIIAERHKYYDAMYLDATSDLRRKKQQEEAAQQ